MLAYFPNILGGIVMEISCIGLRRWVHTHTLGSGDVPVVQGPGPSGLYSIDQIYVETEDDDITIISGARKLSLSGNYVVRVRLTRGDIANLARVAFEGQPFGQVVDALSKRKPGAVAKAAS